MYIQYNYITSEAFFAGKNCVFLQIFFPYYYLKYLELFSLKKTKKPKIIFNFLFLIFN